MPPGPAVTLTTPGLCAIAGVTFRRHGASLFVVTADVLKAGIAAEGVIQKHRVAASH
jgi:hypothetical protein